MTKTLGIDGSLLCYTVEDEVSFVAPSNEGKAIFLQRLRFDDSRVEYRICYYMIAHKPRMKGRWAFGQFAPMLTGPELKFVFEKAKEKGWL